MSTAERCDHKFVDSNVCLKCGWHLYRYSVVGTGCPWSVVDNRVGESIALCSKRESAQLIANALNYPPLPKLPRGV